MDHVLGRTLDQSHYGNNGVTDLVSADDSERFYESLEALVLPLEETKPMRLEISWPKTKLQVFVNLMNETFKYIHASEGLGNLYIS